MYIATSDMLIDLGRFCPKLVELSLKGESGELALYCTVITAFAEFCEFSSFSFHHTGGGNSF
jgi:hypothetical protein